MDEGINRDIQMTAVLRAWIVKGVGNMDVNHLQQNKTYKIFEILHILKITIQLVNKIIMHV